MSDRKSVDLLKQITRDPSYVSRLSGADVTRAGGRQWDARFAASAGIPKYDAVNDRFCKFALRRRNAERRAMTPKGRGGPTELAPLPPQQRRLWGHAEMPEPPRYGATPDPTSFRGTVPQMGTVMPTALARSAVPETPVNVESLASKARQRLTRLWEELGVPDAERMAFAQQHFHSSTSETVAALNAEIQKLVDERNCAMQVERAIEIREGFLYLLQELTERYAANAMEKERAARELQALLGPYRNASLDAVEGVTRWREAIKSESQPYLWKGVSYLHKMNSDLFFLAHSRLRTLLDFEVAGNPLLDPRRSADASGPLPPLRRGPTMTARDAAMKDLPKERIDRAFAVLDAEARRQKALPRGDAQLTVDEAAHLRGLTTEHEEKQQLIAEEDAWLRDQPTAKSTQEVEHAAAAKIQATYRAYVARRFVQAKLRQHKAAVKLQSITRQFLAKVHVAHMRRQVLAARKIQALQRGLATRSRMAAVHDRHAAAMVIQRTYRAHAARRFADMLRYVRDCAVAVQRVYRGYRERKAVRTIIHECNTLAATTIQRHWRGYLVRRNPRNNCGIVTKATKLQAWFRGCNARRRAHDAALKRYAATRIQAMWRGTTGRRIAHCLRVEHVDATWEVHLARMTRAALKIQSAWRMCVAKAQVELLRDDLRAAQRRAALDALESAKTVEGEAVALQQASAVKVQALVRGHLARRKFRCMMLLNLTAMQIQRVVRGHLGRRRHQRLYREKLRNCLAAQYDMADISPVAMAVAALRDESQLGDIAQRLDMEAVAPRAVETTASADDSAVAASDVTASHAAAPTSNDATAPSPAQLPVEDIDKTTSAIGDILAEETETVAVNPIPDVAMIHEQPAVTPDDAEPEPMATDKMQQNAAEAHEDVAEPVASVGEPSTIAMAQPNQSAATQMLDAEVPPAPAIATEPSPTIVAVEAVSPVASAGLHEAAGVITRFFRWVKASRQTVRMRRHAARKHRDARAQEVETAVRMLQRWHSSQLALHHARAQKELQRHAVALRRSRLGSQSVQAQERDYAARILQLRLRPLVVARGAVAAQRALRGSAQPSPATVQRLERDAAARVVQRALRARLNVLRGRRLQEELRRARAEQARRQERAAAATVLQRFSRASVARQTVAGLMVEREACRRTALQNEAASVIQVAFRAAVTRRQRHRRALDGVVPPSVTGPMAQEQAYAAASLTAWARGCLIRKRRRREADIAAEAREAAAGVQEEKYEAAASSEPQAPQEHLATPTHNKVRRGSHGAHVSFSPGAREHSRILEEPAVDVAVDPEAAHDHEHLAHGAEPQQQAPSASSPDAEHPHVKFAAQPVVVEVQPAHVSFSPGAREHSRILQEPAIDVAVDPEATHDHDHLVRDTEAQQAPPSAALDGELHHVSFAAQPVVVEAEPASPDTRVEADAAQESCAPAVQEEGAAAAGSSTPVAESAVLIVPERQSQPTAVVVALNEYETERAEKMRRRAAATKIQCAVRQRQARAERQRRFAQRKDARKQVRKREVAALIAQAAKERAREEATVETVEWQRRTVAATKIQCAYRCYNARFMRAWMLERRRLRQAAKADHDVELLVARSAVKIQSVARRMLARLEFRRLRRLRDTTRRHQSEQQRREERAAIAIQCAYRSYNARFEHAWRLRDKRSREAREDELRRAAADNVERAARDRHAHEARVARAALTIQCAYRSYNARFALFLRRQAASEKVHAKQAGAAKAAQRTGRGFAARISVHRDWAKSNNEQAILLREASMARAAAEDAINHAMNQDPRNDPTL
jgi:hypothetical protein